MSRPKVEAVSWSSSAGQEVVLCAIGARTPLGLGVAPSAAAVRGGISAITVHHDLLDKVDAPMALACDAEFDPDLAIAERLTELLSSAIDEACGDLLRAGASPRLKCRICLPEPRPGVPEDVAHSVAAHIGRRFGLARADMRVIQQGHAAGLMAMQAAAQEISAGKADLVLVACADSYRDLATLTWLDHTGWLMSATNRNGFPPGEAGSACLLASRAAADRLGLSMLATLAAASSAIEPIGIRNTTDVCVGEALTAVINGAAAALRRPEEAITGTYCDLNGQRYRSEELVYSLLRVQMAFVDAHDYLCPADCWGDVGAASGPLYAALAVSAHQRGYAKGPLPLLWAGAEGGLRAAVVLRFDGRTTS